MPFQISVLKCNWKHRGGFFIWSSGLYAILNLALKCLVCVCVCVHAHARVHICVPVNVL